MPHNVFSNETHGPVPDKPRGPLHSPLRRVVTAIRIGAEPPRRCPLVSCAWPCCAGWIAGGQVHHAVTGQNVAGTT